jgi:hypothetical protein
MATPGPNANGWNNTDVTVAFSATDAGGSDVNEIRYTVNGGAEVVTAGPGASVTFSAQGTYAVAYWATDKAGNVEAQKSIRVKIDKTVPTISVTFTGAASVTAKEANIDKTAPVSTATPSPAPNASGWNKGPVTVTLAATDALSGVAKTEYKLDFGASRRMRPP